MSDQADMFLKLVVKKSARRSLRGALTAQQLRAINWKCEQGYRPELSVWPDYRFTNKQTGREQMHNLGDLVDEYKQSLKEAAKERAKQKYMEKNNVAG